MNVSESMEAMFNNLERFLKTDTVIGQPIQIGQVTLVPVISITFGAGGGGGEGRDGKGNDGTGLGLGGGARVSPDAVIVIKGDDVSMLPIKNRGGLEKILEMVPDIVSKLGTEKEENEK